MQRCRQCEHTMTPTETVCISCGSAVQDNKPKSDAKTRFRTGIKFFMFGSAGLTLASLFVSVGPSFATCAAVTVVLFLAKSSAEEMLIDREKE
ncbi:MAG: hypothetical protein ABI811_02250 [Acidobacteriota bacterium]